MPKYLQITIQNRIVFYIYYSSLIQLDITNNKVLQIQRYVLTSQKRPKEKFHKSTEYLPPYPVPVQLQSKEPGKFLQDPLLRHHSVRFLHSSMSCLQVLPSQPGRKGKK